MQGQTQAGAAAPQAAFFRTNNSGYGTQWASNTAQAIAPEDVASYKELVSLANQ